MFCTQCGKKIEEGSIFCEFCGTKQADIELTKDAESTASEPVKGSEVETVAEVPKEIINKELKKFADHLGFLGYEIEKLEVGENKEWVLATHPTSNNAVFFEIIPGFILFQVNLNTGKKHEAKMDVAVNIINKELNLARFYYVLEEGLAKLKIEAVYTGSYVKETFGQFHELFENDQKRAAQIEDFVIFLKE